MKSWLSEDVFGSKLSSLRLFIAIKFIIDISKFVLIIVVHISKYNLRYPHARHEAA
jgi:hypothetical protein